MLPRVLQAADSVVCEVHEAAVSQLCRKLAGHYFCCTNCCNNRAAILVVERLEAQKIEKDRAKVYGSHWLPCAA
jgi:hypothetical protein